MIENADCTWYKYGLVCIVVVVYIFASASTAIAADAPAGIVIDVGGSVNPSLSPFSEIPPFLPIHVDDGSKLAFIHYRSCVVMVITGGTVILGPFDIDDAAAKVEKAASAPCPRVHRLSAEGSEAAVALMRGAGESARSLRYYPTQLDLHFVGSRAGDVVAANITDSNKQVVAYYEAQSVLKAKLISGDFYALNVFIKSRPEQLTVFFEAVDAPPGELALVGIDQ